MANEQQKEKPKRLELVPKITQKLLTENRDFQRTIRRTLNISPASPAQTHRATQMLLLEEINALMRTKFAARRAAMAAGDQLKREELDRTIAALSEKASKAHFELGNFEMAANHTRDPQRRRNARAHARAMAIDDDAHCEHPKYKQEGDHRYPNYFRERDIYSERHGKIVSVIKCNEPGCQFRNIKELPEDLAEASRRRAEFRKEAKSAGRKAG
jgi:hypothetical protein